LSDI
jgi:hypothetical protein